MIFASWPMPEPHMTESQVSKFIPHLSQDNNLIKKDIALLKKKKEQINSVLISSPQKQQILSTFDSLLNNLAAKLITNEIYSNFDLDDKIKLETIPYDPNGKVPFPKLKKYIQPSLFEGTNWFEDELF